MSKQLTKAEEQIMQVLWDLQETSVKEVIEKLYFKRKRKEIA